MALKRPILERSLQLATSELEKCVKSLEGQGINGAGLKRNPQWRNLNAKCRAIRRRIQAADAVTARDADVERRKAEKLPAAE